jgi:hypothetical protein
VAEAESYVDAVGLVLRALRREADPVKCLWCNYPVFQLHAQQLEKVRGEPHKLWPVGVPAFKVIGRGVAHLACEIDLYYLACDDERCWYDKLVSKADEFKVPLALLAPLAEAASQGKLEIDNARITERAPNYTEYEYLGAEWRIPDAFVGFIWALKEKGESFKGLLEPASCILIEKFARQPPEAPRLAAGTYDELVSALRGLGIAKSESEEAARYAMQTCVDASLEDKIKCALKYSKPA